MGAYLSEPITDKISSDEANERLAWGTSSMQGWRISQEDAHNCVTEYDENTSYFAVYDGHGGSEVATYCAQKLPDFIKQSEAYKNGDLSQALIDGYLGFDATIVTKDVIKILKELAGNKQGEEVVEEEEDEDDNVLSLKKEAHMPLEEVMAKYQEKGMIFRLVRDNKGNPLSPFLKGKGRKRKDDAAGSSGDTLISEGAQKPELNDDVSSSTSDGCKTHPGGDAQVSTSNGDTDTAKADSGGSKSPDETSSSKISTNNSLPDSSNDNCKSKKEPDTKENIDDSNAGPTTSDDHKNVTESKPSNKTSELSKCNGDVTESTKATDGNVSSSSQEKERKTDSKGKGKAKASVSSSESPQKENSEEGNTVERTKRAAALYNNLLNTEEDDDDSDSNDENFEGQEEQSSSDENEVNGVENGSSGDDENDENEEEESSDEEEDEDEEYDESDLTGSDEPGMDSGCTAVVAVLKGNQLYVANAGDSRCIVCREGQAIDMSIDHKPEDPLELARVEKAGGKVNGDGRINGGLNLSRAIGDHSYKQNKELDDKEQMITALPDIKTLDIDPEKDQFMVLACDGIWNYMTSQEVVDFVAERISDESKTLSQICEELFCKCLAPSTVGDGTGCDNMTAIIIKFKSNLSADANTPQESTKKRPADNEEEPDESVAKRQKTDEEAVMSAAVTSSE